MEVNAGVQLFAALLAIMNPLSAVPVFLGLTEGFGAAGRRRVALQVAVATFVTLVVVLLGGERILAVFGITLNDFRVAGGILIFLMALSLLRAKPSRMRHVPEEASDQAVGDNPAFFPLAVPFMAGPGAMTAVILFADRAAGIRGLGIAAAIIAAVCVIIFVTLAMADWLAREVGVTGMNIMTRLMGLILSAVAVSMIFAGLKGAFPFLAQGG